MRLVVRQLLVIPLEHDRAPLLKKGIGIPYLAGI